MLKLWGNHLRCASKRCRGLKVVCPLLNPRKYFNPSEPWQAPSQRRALQRAHSKAFRTEDLSGWSILSSVYMIRNHPGQVHLVKISMKKRIAVQSWRHLRKMRNFTNPYRQHSSKALAWETWLSNVVWHQPKTFKGRNPNLVRRDSVNESPAQRSSLEVSNLSWTGVMMNTPLRGFILSTWKVTPSTSAVPDTQSVMIMKELRVVLCRSKNWYWSDKTLASHRAKTQYSQIIRNP